MPNPKSILLPLIASLLLPFTTNAVDLRLYLATPNCTGAYISCLAHEPEACCSTGPSSTDGAAEIDIDSVMWTSIPTEWSLIFSSYTGGECGRWLDSDVSAGRESVCGAGGAYTGISYEFLSLLDDGRKGQEEREKGRYAGGKEGEEGMRRDMMGLGRGKAKGLGSKCKRADVLVLENGTELDLSGLDHEAYTKLLWFSSSSEREML